jgi:hypothetical protein
LSLVDDDGVEVVDGRQEGPVARRDAAEMLAAVEELV